MGSAKPSSRMPIRSPRTPPSRSDSASMLSGMPRRWRGSLSSYPATACNAAATSGHRARHRPDVIHAGLGGEADREVRHQPERRLQPDHAAIGRGQPDGAALVAAERDVHLARGQRGPGARRGPAGDARRIVRVQRLAVVAHEPVHHVLADDLSPGRQHPRHDGRVDVGDEALHRLRGEDLRDAGHADMVLEADRLAGQQSAVLPPMAHFQSQA